MTFATLLTLLFWWGAGFMVGGTIMIVIAVVGASVASAFGWQVDWIE
jgi:hypothetical protein